MTNLTLEFDKPDRRFKTGEEVSGFVTVDVYKVCHCRGLSVTCEWRTDGRGYRKRGSTRTEIVFEGDWIPGGLYRYPFSFIIPNGPVSYAGEILTVDWHIRARADIPWSHSPQEEADFFVELSIDTAHEPYLTGDPDSNSYLSLEQRVASSKSTSSIDGIAGLILLAVAVISCTAMFLYGISVLGICSAMFCGVMGTIYAIHGLRNCLTMKHADIQVQIPQKRVHAGGIAEVLVAIPNPSKNHLNKVTARLTCIELDARGRYSRAHTVHDLFHVFEGSVDRELGAGESVRFSHRFRLPESAPPSFHTTDQDLVWEVAFLVDIAGMIGWTAHRPLEVLPALPKALISEPASDDRVIDKTPNLTEGAW